MKIIRKNLVKVIRGDFSLEKPESAGCPGLQILCLVFEIDNRDIFKGYRHMPEQDWSVHLATAPYPIIKTLLLNSTPIPPGVSDRLMPCSGVICYLYIMTSGEKFVAGHKHCIFFCMVKNIPKKKRFLCNGK